MDTLMDRVKKLQAEGIPLGGMVKTFESGGRKQFITLVSEGLTPGSKVLDVGCGCLRGGYWLIHFLDQGCYFGIEPNVNMVEGGIRILLEPGLVDLKKPRFDHNENFDFTVFGEKFDFLLARSIWAHAAKSQIQTMLDSFVSVAKPSSKFITSFYKPTLFHPDYKGTTWVGMCHKPNVSGFVHHSMGWIQKECAKRGLVAREKKGAAYNYLSQLWLVITLKNK